MPTSFWRIDKIKMEISSLARLYYARIDVQEAIAEFCKGREVAIRLQGGKYGKRPDALAFSNDVGLLSRSGATSFHCSVEHWHQPLNLETGMTTKDLNALRNGWDFLIDIDAPDLELSKIYASCVIDFLDVYQITPIVKYSGNMGFHIILPKEAFPKTILMNGKDVPINDTYPYVPRKLAKHMDAQIRDVFIERANKRGFFNKEVIAKVHIDSVLISSRHMIRAPYSLHEKSGLASVFINPKEVLNFDKLWANPHKVIPIDPWKGYKTSSVDALLAEVDLTEDVADYRPFTGAQSSEVIGEEDFPTSIKEILSTRRNDGRKRCEFILRSFLLKTNWPIEQALSRVLEWNRTMNDPPIDEGYIRAQFKWNQKRRLMPPNYTSDFYSGLGITAEGKNPVAEAFKKRRYGKRASN